MAKALLFFYTLRHLKPVQFYWRVYLYALKFMPIKLYCSEIEHRSLQLLQPIHKYTSFENDTFVFLNVSGSAAIPIDWNNSAASKLWLYNLHYFDFINQGSVSIQAVELLMNDWVLHNPLSEKGNGWEPYPISLRVVNWIKYLSCTEATSDRPKIINSLFLQGRVLARQLEYHLLGNHLFKNGVALLFLGAFFKGQEAERWLAKGLEIVNQQIKEQILPDGGHFERSPMYHSLILEDILDCLNLQQAFGCFEAEDYLSWQNTAANMLIFLKQILHPDGGIPFFNDSAFNIAPTPAALFAYAQRLNVAHNFSDLYTVNGISVNECTSFGLIALNNPRSHLIFDSGPIGPDYLPGHAHCDSLSYELSVANQRCIVNSGTYEYAGDLRNHFRGTSAHNTVAIDKQEQHELWSTFRVARRGYPFNLKISTDADAVSVSLSHDGYRRLSGRPIHNRQIKCQTDSWLIADVIDGDGHHLAESFIHLHPVVEIVNYTDQVIDCVAKGEAFSIHALEEGTFQIIDGLFSAEFGLKEVNKVLVLRKQGMCPLKLMYHIKLN